MSLSLEIAELSLVLLVGPSGSGKTSWASRHFKPSEVLSSDHFRELVSDDASDQSASQDAFELLRELAVRRLRRGRLCVIDATNLERSSREGWIRLAQAHEVPCVVIVLAFDLELCLARNQLRPGRQVPRDVLIKQHQALGFIHEEIQDESYSQRLIVHSPEDLESLTLSRKPHPTNLKQLKGPFDIIGDVHGCDTELTMMLAKLGYQADQGFAHPEGRTLVFVGDLVDRGPGVTAVLDIVMDLVEKGRALCVRGNHEAKLLRLLKGREVQMTNGLLASWEQLQERSADYRARCLKFFETLSFHYQLDEGRLLVAHAGLPENLQGRSGRRSESFALYGLPTGTYDEGGHPIRANWAEDYEGRALVVHGHTPVLRAVLYHNTVNLDTGCVYGGKLSALRYPELQILEIPAASVYYARRSPLPPPPESD